MAKRAPSNLRIERWKNNLLDFSLRNRLLNFREAKSSVHLNLPSFADTAGTGAGGGAGGDEADFGSSAIVPAAGAIVPFSGRVSPQHPPVPYTLRDGSHSESVAAAIEDLLAEGTELPLLPASAANRPLPRKRPVLLTTLDDAEHARRLTKIYRAAKNAIEENGCNSLFAAVGFLEWRDEAQPARGPFRAPLLLAPVELVRKSVTEGFALRRLDEDAEPNITLLEFLRQTRRLNITGLDPLPEDANGVDVLAVLRKFAAATAELANWRVLDDVFVGPFSFAKFMLWRDLDERAAQLPKNRVLARLLAPPANAGERGAGSGEQGDSAEEQGQRDKGKGQMAATGTGTQSSSSGGVHAASPIPAGTSSPPPPDSLHPTAIFCTRGADSSQLAAILDAGAGGDFVLDGPPGTGKSQTITNIIAHSLALGRRVLFVAEKRAALDVVHRRLREDGLEPFTLELHSNKTGKQEVLAQFKSALETAGDAPPALWQRRADELAATREQLNAHVHALHKHAPCGLSAFDCVDFLLPRRKEPVIALDAAAWPDPPATLPEKLEDARRLAAALDERATAAAPLLKTALAALDCDAWSPAWAEDALEKCRALSRAAASESAAFELATGATATTATTGTTGSTTTAAQSSCSGGVHAATTSATSTTTATTLSDRRALAAAIAERAALLAKLAAYDRAALLALPLDALLADARAAAATWFLPRFLARRKIAARLASVRTDARKPAGNALAEELAAAVRLRTLNARLGGDADSAAGQRLARWRDSFLALERALDGFAGTVRLRRAALDTAPDFTAAAGALADALPPLFGQELRIWCAWRRRAKEAEADGLRALVATVEAAPEKFTGTAAEKTTLAALFERSFRRAVLNALVGANAALREFFGTQHEKIIERFSQLDDEFTALTRKTVRARLAAKIAALTAADAAYDGRRNGGKAKPEVFVELALLRKEIAKKMRHLPVRQLLARLPATLPVLKPCLLMSPLSVAQYLAPEHPPFDLVIFDEASQIPVWDAAGAIARGTQLIVVGDPRQLPPTNFFNATTGINGTGDDFDWPADADSTDADGTVIYAPDGKIVRVKGGAGSATGDAVDALPPLVPADLVDLESILDELLASSIPIRRLRWHYRSRREALITFSNRHYYAGDLFTFPSPETGRAGLALHYLPNARYDRAKSRTNLAEAQALVAELTRRLLAHEAVPAPVPPVSYGVVTFSVAQQELVENLLDAVRREHPELERWFGDTPPVEGEPVFVKNLENVQGDERDVVLFSVCYGPDADGRVALNFGPLNRAGGERRLNVAVTRAKREMVVFTSMRSDQIDTSRVSARGVRDLREFLRFCEEGGERGVGGWEREIESGEQGAESGEQEKSAEDKNESTAAGAAPPEVAASEATRLIGAALRRRGYDVRHRVGCSDYRLDIGVVDPRDPSRFLLGIECDGDAYRSAGTARDRDKLRHEVLTGLGWRLHRLWLLDWWNAPDAEFTKLLATLDTAKATRQ